LYKTVENKTNKLKDSTAEKNTIILRSYEEVERS